MNCNSKYEIVATFNNVKVKVPSANCLYMQPIPPHEMTGLTGEKLQIKAHYRHGLVIKKVIITRNFYVQPKDRGNNIVAKVIVIKKTIKDGRIFTILDIKPMEEGEKSRLELKYVDKRMRQDDIPIHNTDSFLSFIPMRKDSKHKQFRAVASSC